MPTEKEEWHGAWGQGWASGPGREGWSSCHHCLPKAVLSLPALPRVDVPAPVLQVSIPHTGPRLSSAEEKAGQEAAFQGRWRLPQEEDADEGRKGAFDSRHVCGIEYD